MSSIKETKVYSINDFINWYDKGELEISPKYQRNPVWNYKAKSYLIDTIIRGLPIPQIFIRQTVDTNTRKTFREVIDGQQRLRAIIEFVQDEFYILRSQNKEYGNKKYSNLNDEDKEAFLLYELPVEVIKSKEDSVIYNLFARLNTNSITLNKQELRNSLYWGDFKVFVYDKADVWRQLFIDVGTFNDNQLSRMSDIEFLSSLVILIIDGVVHETQKVIDNYYKKYDDNFENMEDVDNILETVIKVIDKMFLEIHTKYFHRKNYFYTLFASILHQMFGISNLEAPKYDIYSKENINSNLKTLTKKIKEFESKYDRFMEKEFYDEKNIQDFVNFEQCHRTRTTSLTERKERIKILIKYLQ